MRLLISITIIQGYGGAPMVMLELAEEFRRLGHEVDLCAWWAGSPMWEHFVKAGVRRLDNIGNVNPFDYDVVFFLHHCAPLHFTRILPGRCERTLVIFFRLSHSSSVAAPSVLLDEIIADSVFVNSIEVRDRMVREFGLPTRLLYLFSNASPTRFHDVRRTLARPLKNVIYVSNHRNPDAMQALKILREKHALEVTHYGAGGDLQTRITPEIISESDAVITMAKTAQYCILAGVPVYVYDDKWGGPGYLNSSNYDLVSAHNFSGSGSPRRVSGETIASEIVSGHEAAARFMLGLPDQEIMRFSLQSVVDKITALIETAPLNTDRIARLRNLELLLNRERCRAQYAHMAFTNWRKTLRELGRRVAQRDPKPLSDVVKIFEEQYTRRGWGNGESVSGTGSSVRRTRQLVCELPKLFAELQVHRVLDLPCGDWNWMREVDLSGIEYFGGEVVEEIVASNRKYEREGVRFQKINLVADPLPPADLILCRDCLVHLSNCEVAAALRNIVSSGARFLLTTTFPGRAENRDIPTGRWRPLNLERAPFHFPPPERLVFEHCTESGGRFADKCLALWRIEVLATCVEQIRL